MTQRQILEQRCQTVEASLSEEQKRHEAAVARLERDHAKQIKELTSQVERAQVEVLEKQAT